MNKINKNHKWEAPGWLFVFCDIILILIPLICAFFLKDQPVEIQLATIGSSITIAIVLVGYQQRIFNDRAKSIQESIEMHSSVPKDINTIKNSMDVLRKSFRVKENIDIINSSGEEKRIGFVDRRLKELDEILKYAAVQSETELLSVPVYYSELNNLATIIEKDANTDNCSIWAMTGFSAEEWHDEEIDLESKWGRRIKKLANNFETNRICIIDEKLAQILKVRDKKYFVEQKQAWDNNLSNPSVIQEKGLKSFFDYLTTYYQGNIANYKLNSYALKDTNQTYATLIKEKGYFGINLSDDNKYVIKGEAVNAASGLEGKFVFSNEKIEELFNLHNRACKDEDIKTLNEFLQSDETGKGFKAFLSENDIVLV